MFENSLKNMGIIIKKNKFNIFLNLTYNWYGLKTKDAFNLEKKCLEILNNNYECICSTKRNHFPIIKDFNEKEQTFYLSLNGISLDKYKKYLKKFKIVDDKDNFNEQINCIWKNLNDNGIKHLDLLPKNICINNPNKTISLIDFDIATINDDTMNNKLLIKRNTKYNEENFKYNFNKIIDYLLIKIDLYIFKRYIYKHQ